MASRRLLITAGLSASVVLVVLFHVPILRAAGRILVSQDPVRHADAIVVPQWAQNAGAIEAADLVHLGVSDRVVVMVSAEAAADTELIQRGVISPQVESWYARLIRSLGVSNVEQALSPVNGTETEGEFIPNWCIQHGIHSVIVISPPDHSRRLRRVLSRSMRGYNIVVMISVPHFSEFNPDHWWETRGGARIEIVELEKLAFDIVRHPFG